MNRARQDAITTEIMEIVGGAEALKSDGIEEHMPTSSSKSRLVSLPEPLPVGACRHDHDREPSPS